MSRFFRSADSTSSSDSDTEEENEPLRSGDREDLPQLDTSSELDTLKPSGDVRSSAANRASADWTNHHREFLLHALLEERCMNEVLQKTSNQTSRRPSCDLLQAEANERYQRLCARLASYNLISTGLEGDQHSVTRQRYRDGLDVLSQQRSAAAVPQFVQRLLTDGDADAVEHMGRGNSFGMAGQYEDHALAPSALVPSTVPLPAHKLLAGPDHNPEHDTLHLARAFTNTLGQRNLSSSSAILRSRYHHDFEELSVLGRGGYGVVYHVRHRLDNQVYAVKKVPISTARLHRIQKRGETEVEEVLRELRTLASLDHPNIVRYFNGWVEWVDGDAPPGIAESQSVRRGLALRQDSKHAHPGAEDSRLETLSRVVTDDSQEEEAGVVFEASARTEIETSFSSLGSTSMGMQSAQSVASGVHFTEATLALHMQMAMYPMSLAEYLAPATTTPNPQVAPPLVHCFHVEPSVRILIAILSGVEYLHSQEIIHRDLKPANIFLGPHSNLRPTHGSVDLMSCTDCHLQDTPNPICLEVRIGDFGLVAVADPESNAAPPAQAVGTQMYRPSVPQACQPSLDIYALGIVAFELLRKFDTGSERVLTLQQLKQDTFPATFGKAWGGKVCEAMKEWIRSMLAQDGNAVTIPELKQKLTSILSMCK